ncbi:2,2-dialkylglycine decarboxylase [Setomelanomma holmii]|uniref:2,2-dialkylglycine decarboxylase n=1 Tax=Setomelanomma holmii TaxID=210430 RepID=A0A9P4LIR3_9PLEO|nr:2,2-dialkylglycine decarboxylase [Setomelanomma holmii]
MLPTTDDACEGSTSTTFDPRNARNLMRFGLPFTPFVVERAQGCYLYTVERHALLDWSSGQLAGILGHSHPRIIDAVCSASATLSHIGSAQLCPSVMKLAQKLSELLPEPLSKSMFLSTGSEACEAAIRMAKAYTGKWEIVGLGSSWHGMTSGSLSAQYHSGRKGHGPTMPGNYMLPAPNPAKSPFKNADGSWNWQDELDYGWSLVDQGCCGSLAAVVIEPILSSGGMLSLPKGYLVAMKKHCEKRNMLLIVDEAQTALGRTGTMFAFEQEGIVPDILVLSKTLGAGFPLSAIITSEDVAQRCDELDFFFCTTHVNDPLPASVGLAVLETVIRDDLVSRARVVGETLFQGLENLECKYSFIRDVRGRGMLLGLEVASKIEGVTDQTIASALSQKMTELGLWLNLTTHGRVFRVAPPLTVSDAEVAEGLRIMEKACNLVAYELEYRAVPHL